jgi:hypothetical protein
VDQPTKATGLVGGAENIKREEPEHDPARDTEELARESRGFDCRRIIVDGGFDDRQIPSRDRLKARPKGSDERRPDRKRGDAKHNRQPQQYTFLLTRTESEESGFERLGHGYPPIWSRRAWRAAALRSIRGR